ncbi:MAG: VWA domain-containing protein, partial [Ignavibacteria bacterium]
MKPFCNLILVVILLLFTQNCFEGSSDPEVVDESKPNTPSPENSSTGQNLVVTLEWEYDGATIFDVYFDTENPPGELYVADLERKSIIVAGLKSGETYYWKVVAKPDDGSSVEGQVWSFTTKTQGGSNGEGYVMNEHDISTEIPNLVNILFQVLDLDGNGVAELSTIDFELYEDGVIADHQEIDLAITKREENSFVHRTVLMLDNSTSLTSSDLSEIKQASVDFVNSLADSHEVAIYQFSEDPELLIDFTDDKTSLENAILNQYVSGYETTDLYGAVIEGASVMKDYVTTDRVVQSSMIIFTDGKDTQGSSSLESAVEAIEDRTVYTVGLGVDIDPDVLEVIGTSGFFSIAEASSGDLIEVYDEISENIYKLANSFYWLTYATPK